MNKNQAKTLLREFARIGCFRTTTHCRKRMKARNIGNDDILNALMWGEIEELAWQEEHGNWKFRVKGKDLDDEELVFVGAFDTEDNSILCITVF